MITEIKMQKEFEEIIKSDISIIDFWAGWCLPCTMLLTIFESQSKKFKNIKFAKVNVDDNGELAGRFGINSIPCLLIFKKGKLIDQIIGALPKEEIEEKLRRI